MSELLADIDRLEQAALRVPDPAGEDAAAPGARVDAVLEEARIQLNALMREALEMDREPTEPEAALTEEDREPEDVLLGVDPSPPSPLTASAPASSPVAPPALVARRDWAVSPGDDRELREVIARRRAEAVGNRRRERRADVESQGISIRVIPPTPGNSEDDPASREVTLVFDLGPHQPPVRVSLPVEATIGERHPNRVFPEPPSRSNRFPLAVAGILALAMVMLAVGFLIAVGTGWVAPRAATATAQTEVSAAPRALPAPPASGVELRVLRDQPTLRAPILASIPNGSRVEVLDGSAVADGFHWIRVRTADGRIGWLASATQGAATPVGLTPTADASSP
jgi:hypothetical protein